MSTSPPPPPGHWLRKWDHIKPKYLVRATEHYIVFIDHECDVDWETNDGYVEPGADKAAKQHRIFNEAAVLETAPCQGLDGAVRQHFKRLIAEAITRGFEHDYANADRMLAAARAYHAARSEEKSRLWYVLASTCAAFLFGALVVAAWTWRTGFSAIFGAGVLWLLLSGGAGAAGALLSVITRSGKLRLDCASGRPLHFTEGASRIAAGALSGLLVGLAIRSGIFLAPLVGGGDSHMVTLVASFASGAVERLASSIISSVAAVKRETASPHPSGSDNE